MTDTNPGGVRGYIEDRMVEAFASAYVGGRGDGALLRGIRPDPDQELVAFVRTRAQEDLTVAQGTVARIDPSEPGPFSEWTVTYGGDTLQTVVVDDAGRDVTEEYLAWLETLPREQADPWKAAACQAALDVAAAFEDNLANYPFAADRAPVMAVARIWRDHPGFRPEWA